MEDSRNIRPERELADAAVSALAGEAPAASGLQEDSAATAGAAASSQPGLSAEWQAYRDALIAAARADASTFAPGDVRAAVPESLRPGKHSVHHRCV